MEDLLTEIEVLRENRPGLVTLLKTLGLGLLNGSQYQAFLQGPGQGSFPVLHDALFWAPKLVEGHLLTGMTILQVQFQTTRLAHMVVHLASHDQITRSWEPDSVFSPLQNSYLLLIALGMDVPPVGALRPFEPWDLLERDLVGLLLDMPNCALSHAEQSSLAAKLDRQYRKLRSLLPIVCAEVDLCVASDLFPIFCKLSDEQQERVVLRNGILREKLPILRKSRHRTPLFFVTLYLEVVDNTSRPISDLFVWGLGPVGILVKKYLMELLQDPNIAPVEMCMVLAALLAFSDIYFLGRKITSQRGECPIDSPYQRPPISNFYEWIEQPSDCHWGWDVIETLICSFTIVFAGDGSAVSAIHQFFDDIQPGFDSSRIPETYYLYWRRRRMRMVGAGDRVMGTVGSKAISTKDLMNVTRHIWPTRGRGASQPLVDVESVTTIESDKEERRPAYLPSSLLDSSKIHGKQVSGADIGNYPQGKERAESSEILRHGSTNYNPEGQNQSPTKKPWRRRLISAFQMAFGS